MKRNKKERLLILQNIILSKDRTALTMTEDDILDTMEDYVEQLPKDQQKLYTLYYINMVSHKDIGTRYGVSGSSIAYKIRTIGKTLSQLMHGGN